MSEATCGTSDENPGCRGACHRARIRATRWLIRATAHANPLSAAINASLIAMTSLDKIDRAQAVPATSPPRHHLSIELSETLRLALPMALTQLGQIAMMTTDLAFIGRLGNAAVAAISSFSPCGRRCLRQRVARMRAR